MKKNLLAFFALASAMFAGCNPEENQPLTSVYLSSFSILQKDNKLIDKDYTFSNLDRTSTINITLPNTVNPDALESIVFRYSTSPEDAIVSVEETVLDNAIDTLSFVEPVELRLSAGEDLWAYTVYIKIAESAKWAVVATTPITDTLYTTPTVTYDQSADKFIIMDALRSKTGNNYPVYYEFSGNRFSEIKVISEVVGKKGLAVDVLNGVPYFAYTDESAATKNRVTVAKVENGTTTLIGEQGAIAKVVTSCPAGLIAESNSSIWYASTANEAYDGTTRRLLNLAKYDGTVWKNATAIEGRASDAYGFGEYIKKVGNVTYLLVCNQNKFSTSIYKLENGTWSTVYESLVPEVPEKITPSTSTISSFQHFAVAADGTIYLCAQVQNEESQFNLCIQKYNAADNKLELVSWIPQSSSTKGGIFPYMELDNNGNPIVVFQGSNDTRCFAATVNKDTKAFEVNPVHNHEADDLPKVIVDKHGTPYIFLLDKNEDRIVVCKPL